MASVTQEHSDQSLENRAWQWNGCLLFLHLLFWLGATFPDLLWWIISPLLSDHHALCKADLTPGSQGAALGVPSLGPVIGLLMDTWSNQANQAQSWDLNPDSLAQGPWPKPLHSPSFPHTVPFELRTEGWVTELRQQTRQEGTMWWGYRCSQDQIADALQTWGRTPFWTLS